MLKPKPLVVQEVPARDFFWDCTVTVESWLVGPDGEDGNRRVSRREKWDLLMQACSAAFPSVARRDGLRGDPRIGYDPYNDQVFFIFKSADGGITFLVSENRVYMGSMDSD